MQRASPRVPPLRFRTLALLGAWLMLIAGQGVFATTGGCAADSDAGPATMDGMPTMFTAGDGCAHCHPQGAACPGLHGCHSHSAMDIACNSLPRFVGVRGERPMPALAQPTSLSFPPPLRPPAEQSRNHA
jgi:hypothetical protein